MARDWGKLGDQSLWPGYIVELVSNKLNFN